MEAPATNQELMTAQEVCERLRISIATWYKLRRDGPGKKGSRSGDVRMIQSRRIGGRTFYLRKSVDEFIHGK